MSLASELDAPVPSTSCHGAFGSPTARSAKPRAHGIARSPIVAHDVRDRRVLRVDFMHRAVELPWAPVELPRVCATCGSEDHVDQRHRSLHWLGPIELASSFLLPCGPLVALAAFTWSLGESQSVSTSVPLCSTCGTKWDRAEKLRTLSWMMPSMVAGAVLFLGVVPRAQQVYADSVATWQMIVAKGPILTRLLNAYAHCNPWILAMAGAVASGFITTFLIHVFVVQKSVIATDLLNRGAVRLRGVSERFLMALFGRRK